mmetsp:Transcript_45549/g.98340  ORF Transcript_45549/g.98340 Transcript_45549/m.98340 type:complete len:181 (+) Transcript_45549:325-867(+)
MFGNFMGLASTGSSPWQAMRTLVWEKDADSVYPKIKVGIHEDAEVVFSRGFDIFDLRVLPTEERPLVDQVISASCNWSSPGQIPEGGSLHGLTRAALRASYRGAYLAAIQRQRKKLFLTLIGGGVFDNPHDMILREIADAHRQLASLPGSCLEEVVVCVYSQSETEKHRQRLEAYLTEAA